MKEGFDRMYGARPLRRTVQRRIENPLAKEILGGRFAAGDIVEVDFVNGEFRLSKAPAGAKAPEPEAVSA